MGSSQTNQRLSVSSRVFSSETTSSEIHQMPSQTFRLTINLRYVAPQFYPIMFTFLHTLTTIFLYTNLWILLSVLVFSCKLLWNIAMIGHAWCSFNCLGILRYVAMGQTKPLSSPWRCHKLKNPRPLEVIPRLKVDGYGWIYSTYTNYNMSAMVKIS